MGPSKARGTHWRLAASTAIGGGAVRSVQRDPKNSSLERRLWVSKLLRGLAAGYGAKKLGGGCFSTVLIFIVLWFILGYFGIFS